jgi:hypothetical protein
LSRSSIIRLGGRDAGIGSGTGQSSIARATVASSPAFPTLGTSRHMARTIRKRWLTSQSTQPSMSGHLWRAASWFPALAMRRSCPKTFRRRK